MRDFFFFLLVVLKCRAFARNREFYHLKCTIGYHRLTEVKTQWKCKYLERGTISRAHFDYLL